MTKNVHDPSKETQINIVQKVSIVELEKSTKEKITEIEKEKTSVVVLPQTQTSIVEIKNKDGVESIEIIESPPLALSISEVGLRGPQGPQGPPGDSSESAQRLEKTFSTLVTISALKIVKADSSTTMSTAFNNGTYEDAKALGITLNATAANASGAVLLFGLIEDAFLNYPINEPLYLDIDGGITLTPPPSGVYTVIIGKGLGAGAIFIDIQEPILT